MVPFPALGPAPDAALLPVFCADDTGSHNIAPAIASAASGTPNCGRRRRRIDANMRQVLTNLSKDEVDLPPVLLRGRARPRPVRLMIQLIRHLRRPVAADVAIEEIAFDRLTESRRAAGAIGFPARRE